MPCAEGSGSPARASLLVRRRSSRRSRVRPVPRALPFAMGTRLLHYSRAPLARQPRLAHAASTPRILEKSCPSLASLDLAALPPLSLRILAKQAMCHAIEQLMNQKLVILRRQENRRRLAKTRLPGPEVSHLHDRLWRRNGQRPDLKEINTVA